MNGSETERMELGQDIQDLATRCRLALGTRARYKDGERLEILEHYHRESWEAIRKVIHDVSNAAHRKLRGSRKGESDE